MNDQSIKLRCANFNDAQTILRWEQMPELRGVTDLEEALTLDFVCRHMLSATNITTDGQVRFIIERANGTAVGTLDIYNACDGAAEVGVFVDPYYRRSGHALEALRLGAEYALSHSLHTLSATVHTSNKASVALFEKAGYKATEQSTGDTIRLILSV